MRWVLSEDSDCNEFGAIPETAGPSKGSTWLVISACMSLSVVGSCISRISIIVLILIIVTVIVITITIRINCC